jgi:hypothetical protein
VAIRKGVMNDEKSYRSRGLGAGVFLNWLAGLPDISVVCGPVGGQLAAHIDD